MKTWQLWVAALVIFCSGIVLGAVGTGSLVRSVVQSGLREAPGPLQGLVEKRLQSRLDLTEEQLVETHRVLTQARQDLIALRKRYQPEVRGILHATLNSLKENLSDAQQRELEDMYASFMIHLPQIQETPQ